MWQGFDPEIIRGLTAVKAMVNLRRQTPMREWPLAFVAEYDALLVVREWPGGQLTAYWTGEIGDPLSGEDQTR